MCANLYARSAEIAEVESMLQGTALSSQAWRRQGLAGRPDGASASLGDMLHRPEVTLEQVPAPTLAPLGCCPLASWHIVAVAAI